MQLVENPASAPHCCFKCVGSARPWYIDTEWSVEWHGAVYICNECVREMAHLAGYIIPEDAIVLREQLAKLETENFELGKQIEGYRKAIDGLNTVGQFNSSSFADPCNSLPIEVGTNTVPSGTSDVGTGARETPESLYDEDLGNLPADDEPLGKEFKLQL